MPLSPWEGSSSKAIFRVTAGGVSGITVASAPAFITLFLHRQPGLGFLQRRVGRPREEEALLLLVGVRGGEVGRGERRRGCRPSVGTP